MTEKIIIDAENAVLGRLASYTAKQLLHGKEVVIVNAEKAIIVGKGANTLERYKRLRALGGSSQRGPYIPTIAEKILKRTIRGMLPYKEGHGREAFKRVKCYNSVPKEIGNAKMIKSGKGKKGISLKMVSKRLGAKNE